MTRRLPLMPLAWANVTLHVAGLALAAMFMRPGSTQVPLADRLLYLGGHPVGWTIAWILWIGCAAVMVAFAIFAASHIGTHLARQAAGIAIIAAVIDVTCDMVYLTQFPELAGKAAQSMSDFIAFERTTNWVSLVVANGLYSASTLVMSIAMRRFLILGWAVFVCGMTLSLAGAIDSALLTLWATPPTIGLYCLWVLLVARRLDQAGDAP